MTVERAAEVFDLLVVQITNAARALGGARFIDRGITCAVDGLPLRSNEPTRAESPSMFKDVFERYRTERALSTRGGHPSKIRTRL